MPSDWPQEARPVTRVIGGDGSTSATFTVPAGVVVRVESVYAELNTAGGTAAPLLTIADDSGAVIARKRQSQDADDPALSSATWALRLADDGGGAATTGTGKLLYDFTLTTAQRAIDTFLDGPMAGALPGTYAELYFSAILRSNIAGVGVGDIGQLIVNNDTTASHYAHTTAEWFGNPGGTWSGGAVNSQLWPFRIPAAKATANYFGGISGSLPGYAEATTRNRQVLFTSGDLQITTAVDGFLNHVFGVWKNNVAITRLAVRESGSLDKLIAGSRFTVWGR